MTGLLAICLLYWRSSPHESAPGGDGPYAVLLSGDARQLLNDETGAAVVWSPTSGELIVPAALAPPRGGQVLWLAPSSAGLQPWRWLPASRAELTRAVSLAGFGANGELRLATPGGPVTLRAGDTWTYADETGEFFTAYYVGQFPRLALMP